MDEFMENGIGDIRGEVIGRDYVILETQKAIIDTCYLNDFDYYETAVCQDNGDIVIVERYDTREEAINGHDSWVEIANDNYGLYFLDPQTNQWTEVR